MASRFALYLWVMCHVSACGHYKPGPVMPPDAVACEPACTHEATLPCGVSYDLCERLCERVAINQPQWPGCVSVATTCDEFNACRKAPTLDGGSP